LHQTILIQANVSKHGDHKPSSLGYVFVLANREVEVTHKKRGIYKKKSLAK